MKKEALFFLIISLFALTSCTAVNTPTATPIAEIVETAVSTNTPLPAPETAVPATPTIAVETAVPTDTPPTQTAQPSVPITAGDPISIGRGVIVEGAFTPSGTAVFVGWAGGISYYDVESESERWWQPVPAQLLAVDLHPDGEQGVVALENGELWIINLADGSSQPFAVGVPFAMLSDVSYSPDGTQIALQSIGPNRHTPIYLLTPSSGEVREVPRSTIDEGVRPYLRWSPDGQSLTVADLDGCTDAVDIDSGESVFRFATADACYDPWTAQYTPDGNLYVFNPITNRTELINPQTGELLDNVDLRPFSFSTVSVGDPLLLSENGRFLINRGGLSFYNESNPFIVYDLENDAQIIQVGEADTVIDGPVDGGVRLAVTAVDDTFLSLRRDGRIVQIQAGESDETIIARIPTLAHTNRFVFSGDGHKIGFINQFGGTVVIDVATNSADLFVEAGRGLPAISNDGELAAVLNGETGEIVIYNLTSGDIVSRLPEATGLLIGGAFSPDGTQLVYRSRYEIRLANVQNGTLLDTLIPVENDTAQAINVIWSPNSDAFVTSTHLDSLTGDRPGPVVLWVKGENGRYQEQYRTTSVRAGYDCCVTLAAFNPSGSRVVLEKMLTFNGADMELLVYDLNEAKLIQRLREYRLEGWQTDTLLLTSEAGYDTRQTVWDVETGQSSLGMAGHTGDHTVSPNGRFFARHSGSPPDIGRAVDVFAWQSQRALLSLTHGGDITQIEWSENGRFLATVATDGTIKVWPIEFTP